MIANAQAAPALRRVRVLVVDDAVVVRRMVSDVLGEDAGIEVVGAAANGRIALQKLTQVNPDVVTLDIEMPEMDGLQTLKALRQTHPSLPVIMFSTLTERGASETLEALSLGASDYVTKPANAGSIATAQERIRAELIPKIKALCGRIVPVARPARTEIGSVTRAAAAGPTVAAATAPFAAADIVAIGVSTGGPNALADLLPRLPADFPVPIVLVQHMPSMFTRLLAERLDRQSALRVVEAQEGDVVRAGTVYIAPGGHHMTIRRRGTDVVVALNDAPPENSCRPAVDVLFRSVAAVYGARTLGVVLTGMGQDGLHGCEHLRAAGGHVIAQDEATSVVWGMPGFVVRRGIADRVLPLDHVAPELVRRSAPAGAPR